MKYARYMDDPQKEAFHKGRAICPVCDQPVLAKCGSQRVDHWSHLGLKDCDPWAENETQWHRAWKEKFPREWQEFTQHDQNSGEKHRADVRSSHGLVLEFQHSHIEPNERNARENFYKNMFWVVNGTRLKRDYPRFLKGMKDLRTTALQGFFLTPFPEECFPANWLGSSVPVVFDFLGLESDHPSEATREAIWCLLPGRAEGNAVVAALSRSSFVTAAFNNPYVFLNPAHAFVSEFAQYIRESAKRSAAIEAGRISHQLLQRNSGRQRFRRF
jgi:competence protein CoiA